LTHGTIKAVYYYYYYYYYYFIPLGVKITGVKNKDKKIN